MTLGFLYATILTTLLTGGVASAGVLISASAGANNAEVVVTVAAEGFSSPADLVVNVWDASRPEGGTNSVVKRLAGDGAYRLVVSPLSAGRLYRVSAAIEDETVSGGEVLLGSWEVADATADLTRLDASVTFDAGCTAFDLEAPEVMSRATAIQSALTIAATEGGFAWRGLAGTTWHDLGSAALGSYVVRLETDRLTRRMRYSVKSGEGDFVALKEGDVEWLSVDRVAEKRAALATLGEAGTLGDVSGCLADFAVAQVGETRYISLAEALKAGDAKLLADARLDLADVDEGFYAIDANGHALAWTDSGRAAAWDGSTLKVSASSSTDVVTSYERQMLGLAVGERPRVEAACAADGTIRLAVGGISPEDLSKIQVEFEASASPDFSSTITTLVSGVSASINPDRGVRYYKINMRVNE